MAKATTAALLAFEAGGEPLTIDAAHVREIVGLPRIARVPHAPASLEGVASVRGSAIPILSVSVLRGRERSPGTQVLILDQEPPVGLLVDNVAAITSTGTGTPLDLEALLRPAFRSETKKKTSRATAVRSAIAVEAAPHVGLLIFTVGEQEFSLRLDQVKETLPLSDRIAPMPNSDKAIVGTMHYRDVLLPVFSLCVLLALNTRNRAPRPGIVIALVHGRPVGFVVDAFQSVTRVPTDAIDAVPSVIARRVSEAKISAICRLDGGRRLVSVLDTAQLLHGLEAGMLPEIDAMSASENNAAAQMTDPFLIFQIGSQTFGLPAAVVEEVVQKPERLTKIPRSPAFIEGVMNLRGKVVPVIDQRARFGTTPSSDARARVIVVSMGDLQAGFVVDGVREVLRMPQDTITSVPEINDGTKVFDRVAVLEGGERIVLLIDPAELLDGTERQMLTALRTKVSSKP